jgi:hypothetical protein
VLLAIVSADTPCGLPPPSPVACGPWESAALSLNTAEIRRGEQARGAALSLNIAYQRRAALSLWHRQGSQQRLRCYQPHESIESNGIESSIHSGEAAL